MVTILPSGCKQNIIIRREALTLTYLLNFSQTNSRSGENHSISQETEEMM